MELRIALSFLVGGMIMMLLFYLFPFLFLGRGVMALAFASAFAGVLTARAITFRIAGAERLKPSIIVLGTGSAAKQIADLEIEQKSTDFAVVGYVPLPGEHSVIAENLTIPATGSLLELAERYGADEIVIAASERRKTLPVSQILDCKMQRPGRERCAAVLRAPQGPDQVERSASELAYLFRRFSAESASSIEQARVRPGRELGSAALDGAPDADGRRRHPHREWGSRTYYLPPDARGAGRQVFPLDEVPQHGGGCRKGWGSPVGSKRRQAGDARRQHHAQDPDR